MKAIPTQYGGVNFRSRLEARWAAFFDLLGWRWLYEATDLEGWIPDFTLLGTHSTTLVEVKPIEFGRDVEFILAQVEERTDLQKAVRHWKAKADELGGFQEVLILGAYPPCLNCPRHPAIGVLLEEWGDYDLAILNEDDLYDFDFCALDGSFQMRLSGLHNGDHYLNYVETRTIKQFWNQASNRVQWKAAAHA